MKFLRWVIYLFALIGFVLVCGYIATKLGWTNTKGIIDGQRQSFLDNAATASPAWISTDEWQTFKLATLKDESDIDKAATVAGVPSRLIVADLAVEQMRLFYSDRELFKQAFMPLEMLGDQSQFSWGVMGIKEDTAIEIEQNLASSTSPFYLGPQYAHLLDFTTSNAASERFGRLTDEKSRYYSYLYAALYIKEILTQWKNAGFDISGKPAIVSTLFNIGFAHSMPNANPQVGGAAIDIASTTYSFGGLAGEFYDSNELIGQFPR